jgi:hypothetical protein
MTSSIIKGMAKINIFELNDQGLAALSEFQKTNEIINFRSINVETNKQTGTGNWKQKVWCLAVLYVPRSELPVIPTTQVKPNDSDKSVGDNPKRTEKSGITKKPKSNSD